jgi:hypothetical protein
MSLDHLSVSAWMAWQECPAAAYAHRVARVYRPGTTKAMALGKVIEAALCSPAEATPESILAKLDGTDRELLTAYHNTDRAKPCADAVKAVEWGRQAALLPRVAAVMAGARLQVELSTTICGVRFVCRPDIITADGAAIWDSKGMAGDPWLDMEYVPRLGCRGNAIAQRGYGYQLALYLAAALDASLPVRTAGLILIGKHTTRAGEAVPNVWMPYWSDEDQLDGYLGRIAATLTDPWTFNGLAVQPIPELYDLPSGAELPRCEACDWCVASRENPVVPYCDPERSGL